MCSERDNNITLRGHEQVDILNDVEEELVTAVLDTLTSPPDLARHLRREGLSVLLPGFCRNNVCVITYSKVI